jgi:hypothetical protein
VGSRVFGRCYELFTGAFRVLTLELSSRQISDCVAVSTRLPMRDVRAPRDPELMGLARKGAGGFTRAWVWGSCGLPGLCSHYSSNSLTSIVFFANYVVCLVSHSIPGYDYSLLLSTATCGPSTHAAGKHTSTPCTISVAIGEQRTVTRHSEDHTFWNPAKTSFLFFIRSFLYAVDLKDGKMVRPALLSTRNAAGSLASCSVPKICTTHLLRRKQQHV